MGASRPESGYNITLYGFSYIFDVLLEYIIVSYFFKGISGLCNDIFLRYVCTCWFETFLIPFFCFLCILFLFECSFLAVFVINKYFRYKIELILLVLLISIIDNYSTLLCLPTSSLKKPMVRFVTKSLFLIITKVFATSQ